MLAQYSARWRTMSISSGGRPVDARSLETWTMSRGEG